MTSQQPTVTIIGHVCIDHNVIDGIKVESWGSSAMYISKYLQKNYGLKSHIIAPYGQDFTAYAADFDLLGSPHAGKTLVYENIVNNGARVQYCHNTEASAPVVIDTQMKEVLRCTDIVIVAPMIANYDISYVAQIMKLVPETCLKVLLPQGYMRHINAEGMVEKRKFIEDRQLLPYFDAMVTSDEDIDNALRMAELWATYKEGSSIVVTQSSKGATLFSGGQITQVPTTPIAFNRIKNPVGSGDMFSAQLALGLYNKLDPADAVRIANETTAKVLLSEPME